MAIEVRPLIF